MGFFDTISDLFGGGSEYTPDGGSSASTPSSNYSYSDLGQSPGAMGGRGPSFGGGDRTPPSPTETTDFVSTPVPTVNPPMSPFQLGFGGAQKVPNYMDDLNTLMGGGGSSDDSDDSPSYTYSDLGQSPGAMGGSGTTFGGGDRTPPSVNMPGLTFVNAYDSQNEIKAVPIANKAEEVQAQLDFRDEEEKLASMTGGASNMPQPFDARIPPPAPDFDALTSLRNPKTEQDFSFREYIGNLIKTGASKVTSLGDFISNLTPESALKYFQDFLKGDPNFKGPSPAQQDLFNVPGPGPAVGGGMPSPSGGGDAGGVPQTPAETVMKKDPCPPGFKLDPILNQCMPIVKSAPTPPPMPTLPQPTAPTGGGIANVYPFTLTPPAGAPIGTVAPIKFTPK